MAIQVERTAHAVLLSKVEFFLRYLPQLRGKDALVPIRNAELLLEMAAIIEIPDEQWTAVNETRWRLGSIIDELSANSSNYPAELIGLLQAFRQFAESIRQAP